jgi:hypothetical protein
MDRGSERVRGGRGGGRMCVCVCVCERERDTSFLLGSLFDEQKCRFCAILECSLDFRVIDSHVLISSLGHHCVAVKLFWQHLYTRNFCPCPRGLLFFTNPPPPPPPPPE